MPGPQTLLVVAFDDGVSVVPVPVDVADAVEACRDRARPARLDPTWIRELVSAGVLAWRPTWKS